MDIFDGLDWGTYYFFRFQAHHAPHFLTDVMMAGNLVGSYLGVAVLLLLAVVWHPPAGRRRLAVVAIATFLIGGLLVEGVKLATQRPRPPDAQNLLGEAGMSSSFPSAAVFMVLLGGLTLAVALERRFGSKGLRIIIYTGTALLIVWVCVAQLWLGLHFVTDVLAGLAGGGALALMARPAAVERKL